MSVKVVRPKSDNLIPPWASTKMFAFGRFRMFEYFLMVNCIDTYPPKITMYNILTI